MNSPAGGSKDRVTTPYPVSLPPSPPATCLPPANDPSRWFKDEVQPHDSSLRSYLQASFPAVRDLDDVVQESYLRLFRAAASQPIRSVRALLFTVAKRLALDTVRHAQASPIDASMDLDELSIVAEEPDVAEAADRHERVRLLASAITRLPDRCRQTFILHKIKGLSRKEVALHLGVSERTVEVQTAKAMKRCAGFLRRRGVNGLFDHDSR